MSSGFKITGLEDLEKAILETYSGAKAKKIRKVALNAGGDVIVDHLKKNFESFKATGYSKDEIMRTDARTKNEVEELKVGWDGAHERWRLVHLNEFGYTKLGKQYTPRGFGVIGKTIVETRGDYENAVAAKLRGSL